MASERGWGPHGAVVEPRGRVIGEVDGVIVKRGCGVDEADV